MMANAYLAPFIFAWARLMNKIPQEPRHGPREIQFPRLWLATDFSCKCFPQVNA